MRWSIFCQQEYKNTSLLLRLDLSDYSDANIVEKGRITVEDNINANRRNKKIIFKNSDPFRSWLSKIDNNFKDYAANI